MGEWSKKVGDKGEEIVNYFFKEVLGYSTVLSNESIDCINGKKHKVRKSDKRTHGIDALISRRSPLEDNLLDIAIISSKFTSKIYPNSPKGQFKEFVTDLAHTIECFRFSKLYSEINQKFSNIDRTDITGILVWASNKSSQNETIIPKVANSLLDNDLVFDKIILVDNNRITFFVETVLNIKERFGEESVSFVYHNTNLNNAGLPAFSYGEFLPINYIFSDLIPIRVEKDNDVDFILFSKDDFSEESFLRLLSFAKSFDHLDSAHRMIFSFPEFNELEDEPKIIASLIDFEHYKLNQNLFIKTHLSNFRNF